MRSASKSSALERVASNIPFYGKKPFLLEVRSSTWFIVATVSTAVFTDIFLYAVIVPVFPFALVERIGVASNEVQHWLSILLSVYGAALLVAAPISGYFSDRIKYRRGVLLFGMVVITGATIMLCLAKTLPLLIVGRILQGAAAGVIWVVGLALLADTIGHENAGQAMGFVGMAYSMAALLAPLLGGIVYDKAGYYPVFGMAFGMCGLDLTLRLLLIEKKAARKWISPPSDEDKPTVDKNGSSTDGSTAAAEGIAEPSKKLPPIVILLKSRRMQAAFWASTVDAMILTAFDTTLPLFVHETFGWNSLGAGLVFLAPLAPAFIQPLWGTIIDRQGPRWPCLLGLLLTIPPWICLRFITHSSIGQKVLFCFLLFVIGLGASLTLAATMGEFTYICAEKERRSPGSMGRGGAHAQSYGLFNVSWAVGSLVGAYWAGGIREAAGWGTMTWTLALLCAVVTVPTFLFTGGWIGDEKTGQIGKWFAARAGSSKQRNNETQQRHSHQAETEAGHHPQEETNNGIGEASPTGQGSRGPELATS